MIDTRTRTIVVYIVDGIEFERREDAIEAAVRRALSGHLTGAKTSIPVADLTRALLEPAVRRSFQLILDLLGSKKDDA